MPDRTIKRGSTGVILHIPLSIEDLGGGGAWIQDVYSFADNDPYPDETNSGDLLIDVVAIGDASGTTYDASHQCEVQTLGTYEAPRAASIRYKYVAGVLEVHLLNAWFAKTGAGFIITVRSAGQSHSKSYTVALSNLDVENGEAKVKDWSLSAITTNITGTLSGAVGSISGITFPAHFADMAITATTGKVTVGTNSDKAGYTDVPGPSFLPPR